MHGAWDSIPNSMMTNANIESSAQVSGGNELTLKYKDGEQKILVTPQTEYYTFEPGSRADLKPGETIFAGARMDNDGKLVAPRVAVEQRWRQASAVGVLRRGAARARHRPERGRAQTRVAGKITRARRRHGSSVDGRNPVRLGDTTEIVFDAAGDARRHQAGRFLSA
jgi:hypothetical protein